MKSEEELKEFIKISIENLATEIEDADLINDSDKVFWLKGQRYALEKLLEWFSS